MSIFQWGNFTLHSGDNSWWRIDCDDFTDSEIAIFAKMISEKAGVFQVAICPPSHPGSAAPRLVKAINQYANLTSAEAIIVDDVLTTGNSMAKLRMEKLQDTRYKVKGFVIFARGECPDWVTPIFQLKI